MTYAVRSPPGAADLVAGHAGQVRQADRPDVGADLFAGLPDRCRGGWLARVHGAAGDIPAVVVAGMAGRQHPACPAGGQDRHRRYGQQLMPGIGPQPACAAVPAWVKPCGPGAGQQPGLPRAGRITGPDGARAGLFAAG